MSMVNIVLYKIVLYASVVTLTEYCRMLESKGGDDACNLWVDAQEEKERIEGIQNVLDSMPKYVTKIDINLLNGNNGFPNVRKAVDNYRIYR